jgi:hypothetical protein
MQDGSLGTLIYVANGDPGYEKERVEVFGEGRTAVLENWKRACLSVNGRIKKVLPAGTGKGHVPELEAFVSGIGSATCDALRFEDAVAATVTTFAAARALLTNVPQDVQLAQ